MKKILLSAACLLASLSFGAAAADIRAGKAVVEKFNCASCHGADFKTSSEASCPKLAGQHADYLAAALLAYQRGGSHVAGRANPIMEPQAKLLSRQDIRNVAAYLSSLPGDLEVRK